MDTFVMCYIYVEFALGLHFGWRHLACLYHHLCAGRFGIVYAWYILAQLRDVVAMFCQFEN